MDDKKRSHIAEGRRLLRRQHSGVLSTISRSEKGFPFGSIMPFMMTEDGNLLIYASDLAQHTRNISADNKVSLCVYDATQSDSQASARVTVLATAALCELDESTKAQYFHLFPQATMYQALPDFRFYQLTATKIRYIGGFGDIYWFSKEEWGAFPNITDQTAGIIAHMHEDHMDALVLMCQQQVGIDAGEEDIQMESCFAEGFHISVKKDEDKLIFFLPFEDVISDKYSVRAAMVALTKKSRMLVEQ